MKSHQKLSLLLTALLAVSAWTYASTEHRRPARTNVTNRPTSRVSPPRPALLPDDEFPVDTTVVYGMRHSDQFQTSVAFDGTNFLVVWLGDNSGCILAARVTPEGRVLDPLGIVVCWGAGDESHPAIVFNGTDFLVVWLDAPSVYGCRITSAGQVRDPSSILISQHACYGTASSVATDGRNCLAVWTDDRAGTQPDIYGARVDTSGHVLDSQGIPIFTAPEIQSNPAVAFDGARFLVAWEDYRASVRSSIYCARVETTGVVLDTLGLAVAPVLANQITPAVAFGDSLFVVAWSDQRNSTDGDIYCSRVAPDGSVLDPQGVAVTTAMSYQVLPKVAFDGQGFALDWVDWRSGESDIYGARVTLEGTLLDTAGIPVCAAPDLQGDPGIAFGDSCYLATWHDYRSSDYSEIACGRMNRAGQMLDGAGFIVSLARPASQGAPCAAFTGSNYLVAWEQDYDTARICFSRLTPDGNGLDSAPHTLCPSPDDQYAPAIAASESCALLVWGRYGTDSDGVVGARVTQSGAVLDTTGIGIAQEGAPNLISVAGDGQDWLTVWDESGDSGWDVRAARVSSAGAVLDTSGIMVCGGAGSQHSPQVAFGDSNYLVTWLDTRFGSMGHIFAGRVTRSGAVLDSAGIQVTFDSAYRGTPHVAFGCSGYLVVWQARQVSGYQNEIYAARLNTSGVVLDSEPILIAGGDYDCLTPSVTFDGTDYFVAWQDTRDRSIQGALVSRWGTVLATFPISERNVSHISPCLALGPNRQVMALYSAYTDSLNHRPVNCNRIWARLPPFEAIEENPTQVASRMTLAVLPNPLSGTGEVRYVLPVSGHVRLGVYDISGRLVRLLADDGQKAGSYALRWNGADNVGRLLANGVYILRLDAGGRSETRTLTIAR